MQSTLENTQAGRVEVHGKAKRDLFYAQRIQEIYSPENAVEELQRFRGLKYHKQRETRMFGMLRHLRRTLRGSFALPPASFRDKYFKHNEGKLIGIEMECVFPDKDCMPKQRDLGQFLVEMCDDGSIRTESDESGSAEVKVIISQQNPSRLMKVTNALQNKRGGINSSCGMHIHLDQRGVSYLTASKRAKRLIKALPALKLLVAPSRLGNNYCTENAGIRADGTQYRHSSNRYRMINFLPAYEEHKTIEVRLHGGTLDFWKILGWINVCQFIMDCTEIDRIAERNARTPFGEIDELLPLRYLQISIEDLIRIEYMPSNLRNYIWKRYRQFHPHPANMLRLKLMEEGKFELTDGMAIS